MGVSRITLLKVATCFTCQSMITGYHVYKHIWEAEDGETLNCVMEITNRRDPFSVAVIKDAVVVGYLARKFSTVSSLFLKQKGTITCSVNGRKRYSRDIPQEGLEMIRNNYYNIIHSIMVKY